MSGNQLLARLSPRSREAVTAASAVVERPHGATLYRQGRRMSDVHFPQEGVYSVILRMKDGHQVEAVSIGSEGMLGSSAFLLGTRSPFDTIAQIAGSTLTLPAKALIAAARDHAEIDELLRKYTVFEQRHAHQSAACNALHHVEQRLARWLLVSHDRVEGDSLSLTQEYIAAMLGIRRQSVSLVAHELQRKGLIRYSRGTVVVGDRPGLEHQSCECYAVVREFYREVFDERRVS